LIREAIDRIILKPVGVLKGDDELVPVLKARLTKREYKLLLAMSEGLSQEETFERLKLDNQSYLQLLNKLNKKLNQERIKQELSDYA